MVKVIEGVPSEWPWHDKYDYLWGATPKNVDMTGSAYDLESKVPFTTNVMNFDDYEGIIFAIDLNSNSIKSSNLMSPSHDGILDNAHSTSYVDIVE